MSLKIIATILSLVFSVLAYSQPCNCPKKAMVGNSGKASKVFKFRNGQTLALCGFDDKYKANRVYSEFSLFHCGSDTAIWEWDATQNCVVEKDKDTLVVKELFGLPIGMNFTTFWTHFYISKFYFIGSDLKEKKYFRNDIPKYSINEINATLEEYKKLTKENRDRIIEVANRLFWSYVSGSEEAEVSLKKIQEQFGPFDGAVAEEWNHIETTYEHWKELNKIK